MIGGSPCARGFHGSVRASSTRCRSVKSFRSFGLHELEHYYVRLYKQHISLCISCVSIMYLKYNKWVKVSLTNENHTVPVYLAGEAFCSYVSDVSYTKMAFESDNVLVMSTHSFLQFLQLQLCLLNTGSPICQLRASF